MDLTNIGPSNTDSCTLVSTAPKDQRLRMGWSQPRLAAVTLILLIAFALSSAFVLRHSKLARRDHLTAIAVAAQLRAGVSKTPPPIRAPD